MFENATTRTKQGDIGEARAIYEYTRLGYGVSRTLFDSCRYDLIIDDGSTLQRVQVKTTGRVVDSGGFAVQIVTTGGNRKVNTKRKREDTDYDILFVMTATNRCWSIPVSTLNGANVCIVVGNDRHAEFELKGS